MNLIKRKARTIPFGYKLAEDTNYLEPIPEELEALKQAMKYLESCSYREVANWLKQYLKNRWGIKRKRLCSSYNRYSRNSCINNSRACKRKYCF